MARKITFSRRSISNIRKIKFAQYSIFEPQLRIPLEEFDRADVKSDEMIGVDEMITKLNLKMLLMTRWMILKGQT